MDEPTQKIISETYRIAQENNKMLRKIDRRQRVSMYWRTFMFIIAIGSALGVYYFLQPYFQNVIDVYDQAQSAFTSLIPSSVKAPVKK